MLQNTSIFSNEAKHERKSARTRAKLMDAAVIVFANKGIESASIKEITNEAEMANGTYYLHFKDKDEIVHEVCTEILTRIAHKVDESISETTDAIVRVSVATRRFIHFSGNNPIWGQAFIQSFWALPSVQSFVTKPLRNDLELGVRQGVFQIEIDEFLLYVFGAILVAALTEHFKGSVGSDAGSKASELLLQMLGVPHDQSKEVAWRAIDFEIPGPILP